MSPDSPSVYGSPDVISLLGWLRYIQSSFPRRRFGWVLAAVVLDTAGGVVFNGSIDRFFHAYDDQTGKVVWETRFTYIERNGAPAGLNRGRVLRSSCESTAIRSRKRARRFLRNASLSSWGSKSGFGVPTEQAREKMVARAKAASAAARCGCARITATTRGAARVRVLMPAVAGVPGCRVRGATKLPDERRRRCRQDTNPSSARTVH